MAPETDEKTKRLEPIDYIYPNKFNLLVLKILGARIQPDSSIFYKTYAFIFIGISIFSYALNNILALSDADGLGNVIGVISIVLVLLGSALKICAFYIKRSGIKELLESLKSDDLQLKDEEERKIVKRAIRKASWMARIVFVFYVCGAGSSVVSMISSNPRPAYQIYFPDWTQGWSTAVIACVYEGVCVMVATSSAAALDTFLPCCLIVLGGLIDALSLKMSKIGENSTDSEAAFHQMLECVERHRLLVKILYHIENLFSVITFIQIFLTGAVLVGLVFTLSLISMVDDLRAFLTQFTFVSSMLIEIYIPCYTANEVCLKSEKFNYNVFSSNWLIMGNRYGKSLVFFMQRLKYPLKLTVGGVFALGLNNFMSIMNSAYSLYTLLRRMNI